MRLHLFFGWRMSVNSSYIAKGMILWACFWGKILRTLEAMTQRIDLKQRPHKSHSFSCSCKIHENQVKESGLVCKEEFITTWSCLSWIIKENTNWKGLSKLIKRSKVFSMSLGSTKSHCREMIHIFSNISTSCSKSSLRPSCRQESQTSVFSALWRPLTTNRH